MWFQIMVNKNDISLFELEDVPKLGKANFGWRRRVDPRRRNCMIESAKSINEMPKSVDSKELYYLCKFASVIE